MTLRIVYRTVAPNTLAVALAIRINIRNTMRKFVIIKFRSYLADLLAISIALFIFRIVDCIISTGREPKSLISLRVIRNNKNSTSLLSDSI